MSGPFRRDAVVASAPRRDLLVRSAAQRSIIDPASAGVTGMPLRFCLRRDLLVRSVAARWSAHSASSGMTGMPLRPPEGPACQVRCATLDDPFRFPTHDKRDRHVARNIALATNLT